MFTYSILGQRKERENWHTGIINAYGSHWIDCTQCYRNYMHQYLFRGGGCAEVFITCLFSLFFSSLTNAILTLIRVQQSDYNFFWKKDSYDCIPSHNLAFVMFSERGGLSFKMPGQSFYIKSSPNTHQLTIYVIQGSLQGQQVKQKLLVSLNIWGKCFSSQASKIEHGSRNNEWHPF